MQDMKIYIKTFGCQMNKLDSELMADALIQHGHTIVQDEVEAEAILVNTCSVRAHAEERAYANLAALKNRKAKEPRLIIGLVGCMAEKDKTEALKRIPYLDFICGPNQEYALPEMIEEIRATNQKIIRTGPASGVRRLASGACLPAGRSETHNARRATHDAYVLAMKGCNNFCSYCIVPYVRGREVSRPFAEIVEEVKMLADNGTKEITLLGQNITAYSDNGSRLSELLKALYDIKGIQRISFITSYPADTTDDLFTVMRDLPKVSRYLHIPAQSGSNRILKAMNRRYTREDYLALIDYGRALLPDIAYSSDFIVGFPGETEADFQDTIDLVKEVQFDNSYIFKYSPRPGTAAAHLKDDVPQPVKEERNRILLEAQLGISRSKMSNV